MSSEDQALTLEFVRRSGAGARPAYQKNDYLAWIKGAKLKTTREKRLAQMLSELASGKKYMNMAWSGSRTRA